MVARGGTPIAPLKDNNNSPSPALPRGEKSPPESLPEHRGGGLRIPPHLPSRLPRFRVSGGLPGSDSRIAGSATSHVSRRQRYPHPDSQVPRCLDSHVFEGVRGSLDDRLSSFPGGMFRVFTSVFQAAQAVGRAQPQHFLLFLAHLATALKHLHNMLCAPA